jgi:hypothetical protein
MAFSGMGIFGRKSFNVKIDIPDQSGKVFLITGGTYDSWVRKLELELVLA